jgi:uncharacterized repeat protein (TIGR03803 family)
MTSEINSHTGLSDGRGNIFSLGMNGTNYRNIITFTESSGSASGWNPLGSLALSGTTLYGMTLNGGAELDLYGNVFSVGTNGTNYRNLVYFTGTATGMSPNGSLTLSDTMLYGMTYGGYSHGVSSFGNIFGVGTNGTNYENLVSFTGTGGTASGVHPEYNTLTLSGTTLYGMTPQGGANNDGNIFSVGTNGSNYQNLVSFTGSGGVAPGYLPLGSLILTGTTLYGMTTVYTGYGNVFSVGTNGTNYKSLLSFTGSSGTASGKWPYGSLILSGTTLYGMTTEGGTDGVGNIFSLGIDGSDYQDLHDFTGAADGSFPYGDLTLSGGTLFGMASQGGASGDGTVFALALPPTPEPSTLTLLGVGAMGLVAYAWRRRSKAADDLDQVDRNYKHADAAVIPSAGSL